jgi:anti-anti-sigma factor
MSGWKNLEVHLHVFEVEPVLAWHLSGLLTNTKESYAFLEELRARLRTDPRAVILNLEKLEHITSAGVGIVAAAYTSAANAGVKLVIAAPPRQVEIVLNLVKLLSVIPNFASEEEALTYLRP